MFHNSISFSKYYFNPSLSPEFFDSPSFSFILPTKSSFFIYRYTFHVQKPCKHLVSVYNEEKNTRLINRHVIVPRYKKFISERSSFSTRHDIPD